MHLHFFEFKNGFTVLFIYFVYSFLRQLIETKK